MYKNITKELTEPIDLGYDDNFKKLYDDLMNDCCLYGFDISNIFLIERNVGIILNTTLWFEIYILPNEQKPRGN